MRIFLLAGSKFIPSTFHLQEQLGLNLCPLATQVTCSQWLLASGPLGFIVIRGQVDPVTSSGFNDCSCFYIFSEELAKAIERNTTAVDVCACCVFVPLDRLNCDVGNDGPVVVFQGESKQECPD